MRSFFFEIWNCVRQAALIGMALFVTTDVILRYIFNSPMLFAADVSGFLLLILTFLGLAYAERMGAHVSVKVLVRLLPVKIQAGLDKVTWIIESAWAVVFCLCVYLVLKDFYKVQTRSLSTDWLLYPFAVIMIVGTVLLVIELAGESRRPLLFHFRRQKKTSHNEESETE